MPALRMPFRGFHRRQWVNIATTVLGTFYLIFAAGYILTGKVVDHLGVDYRTFRASAEITWKYGFAHIYDQARQDEFQEPWYRERVFGTGLAGYAYAPTYYLPVFVLIFLPLLLFEPRTSFYVWSGLNLLLLVLYLWRFSRALKDHLDAGIVMRMVLCLPVFASLLAGQVNVLLLICMGEFVLAIIEGKDFRSGLWLAGLLIKFQLLILFLPGLLIGRRFKVLAGFAAAALVIVVVSILLVGVDWVPPLLRLYLVASSSTGQDPTINPQLMMNWRSLGQNLGMVTSPPLAWALAIAGMVVTAAAGLSLWVRRIDASSPRFGFVLLGTFAATCATTWHSHVYTGLPLIPLLLFLYAKRQVSWEIPYLWLYVPVVLFPLAYVLAPALAFNMEGLIMLALNVALTALAVWKIWHRPAPAGPGPAPAGL